MSRDRALVVGALIAWVAAAVIQLAINPPLGHDDAAYLIGAQRWWAGEPALWINRSVGTELLAMPAAAFGWGVAGARVFAAVLGLTVPVGGYLLARATFSDSRVGPWTAAVLAGAQPMIVLNAELLGDLSSTGLILIGLAVLVRELSRDAGPTWRLVIAAPVLVAGFYVRYASITVLAVGAVAALVTYRRAILRRPLPVLALCAVGAALLVPHAVQSLRQTGSVLGLLNEGMLATRLAYPGEGLVSYLTVDPFRYYGWAVAPLMIAGLATAAFQTRAARFVAAVAVGQIIVLGIRSHAQPRYVFIAVALLAMLGIAAALRGFDRLGGRARTAAAGAAFVIAIGCAAGAAIRAAVIAVHHRDTLGVLADIGAQIAADANGRSCVVILRTGPQVPYYSGCEGYYLGSDAPPPSHRRSYVVSVPLYPIDPQRVARELGTVLGTLGPRVVIIETR